MTKHILATSIILMMLSFIKPAEVLAHAHFSVNPEVGGLQQVLTGGITSNSSAAYLGVASDLGYQNQTDNFSAFLTGTYFSLSNSDLNENELLYGLGMGIQEFKLRGGLVQSSLLYTGLNAIKGQGYWVGLSYNKHWKKFLSMEFGVRFMNSSYKASSNTALSQDASSNKYLLYISFPLTFIGPHR